MWWRIPSYVLPQIRTSRAMCETSVTGDFALLLLSASPETKADSQAQIARPMLQSRLVLIRARDSG